MTYNLGLNNNDRNEALCSYLCQRFGEYAKIGGQKFLEIYSDKNLLRLSIPSGNHIDITPSFCGKYFSNLDALIIEADIDPEKNNKLKKFLEEHVENDSIFAKGNALYSDKREKEIPKWQEALERVPSSEDNKLVSIIKDRYISTSRLKNTFFEYMARPLLFFLIHEKKL